MFDSQEDPEVGALKRVGQNSLRMITRFVAKIGSYVYGKMTNGNSTEKAKDERSKESIGKEHAKGEGLAKETAKIGKDKSNSVQVEKKPPFEQKKQEAIVKATTRNSELSSLVKERARTNASPSLTK